MAICASRRDADRCPGGIALHEAQDGALARIRVVGGRLGAGQLDALAACARFGNGLVELTSRANVQVRGLRADAAASLVPLLSDAELFASATHDRVRNILASPLAGRHPRSVATTDGVVGALDAGLCAAAELAVLPGRFLFAADDGSGLALEPAADAALVAEDARRFRLVLAGERTTLGAEPADAPALALEAARAFLALRAQRQWRISELDGGARAVARALGGDIERAAGLRRERLEPGLLAQGAGGVAVTALVPLGRLDVERLVALAAIVRSHGGELRIGAGRTVTLVDQRPDVAARLVPALTDMGLVMEPDSGWAGLSACAGAGRCARARLDVAAAAAARATARVPNAPPEHWSACERRCGGRSGIAVTATADGIVIERDRVDTVTDVDDALAVLA
jgi:sulfite reductase beta subunit-like hemoprotein